jgi:hypothetical protein
MDHDDDRELDQILERERVSTLKALNAVVDVEQRLRDLCRDLGLKPDLASDDSSTAAVWPDRK